MNRQANSTARAIAAPLPNTDLGLDRLLLVDLSKATQAASKEIARMLAGAAPGVVIAQPRAGRAPRPLTLKAVLHDIFAGFRPYRPEKHYMRGPGPATRAARRRQDVVFNG